MTKPTQLKLIHGTTTVKKNGKKVVRDSGKREILPTVQGNGLPVPPPSITTEFEKQVWDRIISSMPNVFTSADEWLICTMVHAIVEFEAISIEIKASNQPYIVQGSMGQSVVNPLFKAKREAANQINLIGRQLGLSPIARNHLTIDNSKVDTGGFDIF